jgi:hypothetical protein
MRARLTKDCFVPGPAARGRLGATSGGIDQTTTFRRVHGIVCCWEKSPFSHRP